jgi:hypothetical protein
MDKGFTTDQFVTFEELVALSGKNRRTIERKLQALKNTDAKTYNEISAHDSSKQGATGGRPKLLFKRMATLEILNGPPPKEKVKALGPKKVQFYTEPENPKKEPKGPQSFDKLTDEEKYTIVYSVCDMYEMNVYLPDACTQLGISIPQFFKFVTASPLLREKWEQSRKNWLITYGVMLENQAYTRVLEKLTTKEVTKVITYYDHKAAFNGEQLVTKPFAVRTQQITEPYIPDAGSFALAKKILDDVALLTANPANAPDALPDMDNMSVEQLSQLVNELEQKVKTVAND